MEEFADIHGQEYRNLGAGRKQQLLFKNKQVAVEIQHLLFHALYLFIQTLKFAGAARLLSGGCRCQDRSVRTSTAVRRQSRRLVPK